MDHMLAHAWAVPRPLPLDLAAPRSMLGLLLSFLVPILLFWIESKFFFNNLYLEIWPLPNF